GPSGSEDHVDRVPSEALEVASTKAMVAFQMANLRFHRATPLAAFLLGPRYLLLTASDVDGGLARVIVTPITLVDINVRETRAGVSFNGRHRRSQRVAVVRRSFA